MKDQDIEKVEIDLLLEAIYQRHGYDFRHYAQASIRRRVRHFLAKTEYTKASELIPRVLYDKKFSRSLMGFLLWAHPRRLVRGLIWTC